MRAFRVAILFLLSACASPTRLSDSTAESHLGFGIPRQVASLTLLKLHVYEDAKYGAVANYRLSKTDSLIVSVYVYPTPRLNDGSLQSLDPHSKDELRGLLMHYEGAKQIGWPITHDEPNGLSGEFRQAALRITDEERGVFYSLLRIIDYGDVRMKFRISYPPVHESAALDVARFLRAYPRSAL